MMLWIVDLVSPREKARNMKSDCALNINKQINTSTQNRIKFESRRSQKKEKRIQLIPLFVDLTRAGIASDGSISRRRYQHQNVFDTVRPRGLQPLQRDDMDYTLQTDLAPLSFLSCLPVEPRDDRMHRIAAE